MADPDMWTGMNPDLLPVKIAFAPSRALRKHYYQCHACQEYVTHHNCKSGWASNPVLMPVDEKDVPLKILNAPEKKIPLEFDYRLYLQKHDRFRDLTVDDDNRLISCSLCNTVVFKVTHPYKEPRLERIEKHVKSKVHCEKLRPTDKHFKPSCLLCPVCNKYVAVKNYKRHWALPVHKEKEEAAKKEDLTSLSAEEANQKMLDKMKEVMVSASISGSALKKVIPFLRQYCAGGGAIPSRRNGQIALGDTHLAQDHDDREEHSHGKIHIVQQ
ncbi:hypothetical protein RvY_12554 [Ramazzottius varieornatus]|uniref:Uncharacterized protein n=1 Tax=Ramazzottius varieornatus TaxID=947166 RepID=A0A1D1VTM4_RAMVA|nr:hypothetical protein RvY_12554 [Ramazzottius varieornatus]